MIRVFDGWSRDGARTTADNGDRMSEFWVIDGEGL